MAKKGKIVEAQFLLPEVIIQHIQSFISGKEAARTIILSKSWHRAWLTRPNLDFDQYGVVIRKYNDLDAENKFWNHVKKTVQRYENLNLKIDSFRLQMHNACHGNEEHDTFSLANEVVVKAMKMGAFDLDFVIFKPKTEFALANEVLGCENLVRLALSGCKIDGKISCSRLESLSLCDVILEAHIIWDIILSCPKIEKLSLCSCKFLLKSQSPNVISEVALSPEFAKQKSIDSYEFSKMEYLLLDDVKVHTSFFNDFSTKFPCLKELSVHNCDGFKAIRISGPSLECINFRHNQMLRVKFDVPKMRKFTFSGSHSPSLSFKVDKSDWESDISIMCCLRPTAAWFLNLNKFLAKLKWYGSKISLSLQIMPMTTFDYVGNLQGVLPKPLVENLKIGEPSVVLETSDCPALLDIIFRCCRPIFMPQSWLPKWRIGAKSNNDFVEIIYKRLMQQVSHQSVSHPCNLEEVIIELYDEAGSVWRPVSWESLLESSSTPESKLGIQPPLEDSLQDASFSTYPEAEKRIRFHLRWGFIRYDF